MSLPAHAGPASDAVRFFYAPVKSESLPEFRERFAGAALEKFEENDKSAGEGEIGCIDFVLSVDAQDLDDNEVARTLKLDEKTSGEAATVTASFNLFPAEPESRRQIVWSLEQVGGAWKVVDIASPDNGWRLSEFDCSPQQ
jgi:hypothetical protein